MNFYSEDIINNIIDNEKVENIIDEITEFKNSAIYLFQLYSCNTVHHRYTQNLLIDEKVKYAFYCMDFEFSIFNCPSMMMYRTYNDHEKNEIKYYILLMCTKQKFRNQGYASKLLDGFIERVKQQETCNKSTKKIKIILSSIEDAVLFYESRGFRWTRETLLQHELLANYEKYEEGKEYFILELCI